MLPVFFGAATRLAAFLLDARKVYRVIATLGVATTTGDAEGEVTTDRSAEPPPALDTLQDAVARFHGEIEQIPPMYSALKRGGVPLYRLARAGLEVERAPRRVVIEELVLEHYDWPSLTLRVRCSKGTYVRTLVEDVAREVGTVGHVALLHRLGVEPFLEHEMHRLPDLEAAARDGLAALDTRLLPPDAALTSWPAVALEERAAERFCHGQGQPASPDWSRGAVRVYGPSGRFIAVGTVTAEGQVVPDRVFVR